MVKKAKTPTSFIQLQKTPTGIAGFDEISGGGLPTGRPTLVCGSAGCGKSLFAVEFLVRGALDHHEPGVLMTLEESADDIRKNIASLGVDLGKLIAQKKIIVDHVHVERSEIEENGEYDLEGLFIRLGHAIDSIGAKRVVLDTIETLFAGLANQAILRAEIRRLFGWLRQRGITTVITGERGEGNLTRQGLEEYVSDCVILLDHRVSGQISTRRLRIVKYRGSTHGTNEYPFLIDSEGISVLPLTSSGMEYGVSNERVSSGLPDLDAMFDGKGYYRGSSILLSGTAGTGKTSFSALMANETCRRGERCLFFSFEESPAQLLRNMHSIGLRLEPHVRQGLLRFESGRPTMHGLEMHLVRMHKLIEEFKPSLIIFDPVSNLRSAGSLDDSTNLLIRLIDFLRKQKITSFFTSLTTGGHAAEHTEEGLSSLVDTWMLVRDIELGGERNRALYVLKSRGMPHSNQVREFLITKKGIHLVPAYFVPSGVLAGSARISHETRAQAEHQAAAELIARKKLAFGHRQKAVEAQIEGLRYGLKAEAEEHSAIVANESLRIPTTAIGTTARRRGRKPAAMANR